jgi:hypothetical protein
LRHLTRRDVLVLLLALSVAPALVLGRIWKANADRGGQQPAEPFRIAGNFYTSAPTTSHPFSSPRRREEPGGPVDRPRGLSAYIDAAEAEFRSRVVH